MLARSCLPLRLRSTTIAGVILLSLSLFARSSLGSAVALVVGSVAGAVPGSSPVASRLATDKSYVDVSNAPNVHLSLRYATTNNFMKKNVYGDFQQCFLHRVASEKFREAARILQQEKPGWKFLVFDCLRPRSIQVKLFEVVEGTEEQAYVANPQTGSIHNYGLALDLSLEDNNGRELDMGTGFDDFRPIARPDLERESLRHKKLTRQQVAHRLLLRKIMVQAGFIQLPIEWWHYDALPKDDVRAHYKIVE